MPAAMKLLKFSSQQCPACAAMNRAKTLERFQAAHPEVQLVLLDCVDKKGETPPGSEFEKNFKMSDVYGVDSFPTIVFESEGGGELASWEGGIPMGELEKLYKAAQARLAAAQEIAQRKAADVPVTAGVH